MSNPVIKASFSKTENATDLKFYSHTHKEYELYLFLTGDVEFYIEGTQYIPTAGDILLIRQAESHAAFAKSASPYHRIVINFNTGALLGSPEEIARIRGFLDDRPLGQGNLYPTSQQGPFWMHYIQNICDTKDLSRRQIYLTVLLHELSRLEFPEKPVPKRDPISAVIDYINANLTESLSLEHLCHHFFISKTQLNRRFRRVTGTTVWDYIVTKRLFLARSLLRSGESPSTACVKSGFRDYCSFSRAYKTHFGSPPREDFSNPRQE